jgi:hypothetical protein
MNNKYCYLIFRFSNNKNNKDVFRLFNKDETNNLESIKRKRLLNCKVDDLINMCKNSDSSLILNDISFVKQKNCYIFRMTDFSYIIFLSNIQVIIHIEDEENKEVKENIRTNNDIYKIMEKNNIYADEIFYQKYKLSEVINDINNYIPNNNKLELRVIKKIIPEVNFGEKALNEDKEYKRIEYSEYFTDYFENFNPKNNQKIFKFEKNKLREEIFKKISKLLYGKIYKQFKITGPFSSGKSITLFAYSRFNRNVIYINLKVLKKNKENYKKCLKIIFSECLRVRLNQDYFKDQIKFLKVEQNVLSQLLYIIEIILNSVDDNIVLICDQFKLDNINFEPNFMKKIEEFLKLEKFRIVFCSSINDQEIRDKIIETWINNEGNNPTELDKDTQKYYFYYDKLYLNTIDKKDK